MGFGKIGQSLHTNYTKPLSQSIDTPLESLKVDDFLQELATIQQSGSKRIAILGSRHVPITHQRLIELMSYALVLGGNRLLTSGATGTNFAAIRGAMKAALKATGLG